MSSCEGRPRSALCQSCDLPAVFQEMCTSQPLEYRLVPSKWDMDIKAILEPTAERHQQIGFSMH